MFSNNYLTLSYLVSGAMLLYFMGKECNNSKIKRFMCITFLLSTSILTSARTGIFSFIFIFVIHSILNFLNLIKKGLFKKSFFVVIANISLIIISYLLVGKTRKSAKFSDSGRGKLNSKGIQIFLGKPLCGIGFGSNDIIGTFPHNLLIQSLAQGGLLYAIPLICFFCKVLWVAYKKDIKILPTIACVLFGSFFIPNILHSRFLSALLLLLSIKI